MLSDHVPISAQRLMNHAHGHSNLALHVAQDIIVGLFREECINLCSQVEAYCRQSPRYCGMGRHRGVGFGDAIDSRIVLVLAGRVGCHLFLSGMNLGGEKVRAAGTEESELARLDSSGEVGGRMDATHNAGVGHTNTPPKRNKHHGTKLNDICTSFARYCNTFGGNRANYLAI